MMWIASIFLLFLFPIPVIAAIPIWQNYHNLATETNSFYSKLRPTRSVLSFLKRKKKANRIVHSDDKNVNVESAPMKSGISNVDLAKEVAKDVTSGKGLQSIAVHIILDHPERLKNLTPVTAACQLNAVKHAKIVGGPCTAVDKFMDKNVVENVGKVKGLAKKAKKKLIGLLKKKKKS